MPIGTMAEVIRATADGEWTKQTQEGVAEEDIKGTPATVRFFLILFREVRRALLTFWAVSALVLAGHAQRFQMPTLPSGVLSDCKSLFLQVDKAVNKAGVQDHGQVFADMSVLGFAPLFK